MRKSIVDTLLLNLSPYVRRYVETSLKNSEPTSLIFSNRNKSKVRINRVRGLREFMQRWDDGLVVSKFDSKSFRQAGLGNINIDGSSNCNTATIFTKNESDFENSIEEGVRKLVLKLIAKLDCITYSSCQGHSGTNKPVRNVGIVPRNLLEYNCILKTLEKIAELTNKNIKDSEARVVVDEEFITSEGPPSPCIDILFLPLSDHSYNDRYFHDVDIVYNEFLKQIDQHIQ